MSNDNQIWVPKQLVSTDTLIIPANRIYSVHVLTVIVMTDATVGNRELRVTFSAAAASTIMATLLMPSTLVVAASLTRTFTFSLTHGVESDFTDTIVQRTLPGPVIMSSGAIIAASDVQETSSSDMFQLRTSVVEMLYDPHAGGVL